MTKVIHCELCEKVAEYTIQATEVAGVEHEGTLRYYCEEHFNETVKELEA